MALFIAAKFSQQEMPNVYDPGKLQDLKPQEFVVVPRDGGEDVAFVATLEHKSREQLKRRREPYPKVIRRASEAEITAWWDRKALERKAFVLCKEKARELRLDMKVSHVRVDMNDNRAVFHFTSEQRVDFRALVRELSLLLKMRIDLWQIGVRDEARMLDGFGVCGLQTCCSTWLKEFRPITIRMAKEQDINLPPTKLSGQCGRLLCCLSYEVDQYKQMSREALPKGATVRWGEDQEGVIVDRNLVAGTYLVSDRAGGMATVKAEELQGGGVRVPEQMRRMGGKMKDKEARPEKPGALMSEALSVSMDDDAASATSAELPIPKSSGQPAEALDHGPRRGRRGNPAPEAPSPEAVPSPPTPPGDRADTPGPARKRRKKGRKGTAKREEAGSSPPPPPSDTPSSPSTPGSGSGSGNSEATHDGGEKRAKGRRKKRRGKGGG